MLNLNTLETVKDSFVDKQQAHFADLIYRVQTTSPRPAKELEDFLDKATAGRWGCPGWNNRLTGDQI
ncbi:MAG: hypothetical protein HQK60_11860 [Deltaproteobacteria bacterium]|nr:hypothetical protein [Deltaproteobacteria bacterium]